MLQRIDIKAKLEDLGVRNTAIFSGIRPTIQIKDDYLTTSMIEFEDEMISGEVKDVAVMFISPKYYANSLWVGKRMEVYEGPKVIGYITVTEIMNSVLDSEADKWILFDGRKIHRKEEFYEQVQEQLEKGQDFQIGNNLNAFNDILWGGFGVHGYGEPVHIIWIYSEESRRYLGEEYFNLIVEMIENHESGNVFLELYKEHAME